MRTICTMAGTTDQDVIDLRRSLNFVEKDPLTICERKLANICRHCTGELGDYAGFTNGIFCDWCADYLNPHVAVEYYKDIPTVTDEIQLSFDSRESLRQRRKN